MAEQTAIEWTDATYNEWWGCTRISDACDFCYAADWSNRWHGGNYWDGKDRLHMPNNKKAVLKMQRQHEKFFLQHGRNRRVFVSSMSDVFDNQAPDEWRVMIWETIKACPDIIFQILTKRPQNIEKMLPYFWDEIKSSIWLGATVENQEVANRSIPHLLNHDAAVRFLSCEPLLGDINLNALTYPLGGGGCVWVDALSQKTIAKDGRVCGKPPNKIDWVITGGESGGRNTSRPANPDWFRSLRDQCARAGVPFLFKQWGNWNEAQEYHRDKKALGRILDGVTHDGFPEAKGF